MTKHCGMVVLKAESLGQVNRGRGEWNFRRPETSGRQSWSWSADPQWLAHVCAREQGSSRPSAHNPDHGSVAPATASLEHPPSSPPSHVIDEATKAKGLSTLPASQWESRGMNPGMGSLLRSFWAPPAAYERWTLETCLLQGWASGPRRHVTQNTHEYTRLTLPCLLMCAHSLACPVHSSGSLCFCTSEFTATGIRSWPWCSPCNLLLPPTPNLTP